LDFRRTLLASAAIIIPTGLAAFQAEAQTFTVNNGITDNTAKTLNGTQTGTVEAGGTLSIGGSTAAITWNSTSTGVVVTNNGTIAQTGTGRGIDTSGGTLTPRNYTFVNGVGATLSTTANDAIRMNTAITGSTITIDNSGLIRAGGTGYVALGQALDLRGTAATSGNTITINNRASGVMEALTDDAVRLGQNFTFNNAGIVRSFGANTSGGANGTSDGIDMGPRTGTTINNLAGGLITGARHGITADTDVIVVNMVGATIIGRNGSGVGSDGNGTVTNYGTITGAYAGVGNIFNSDGTASINGDGDGVDIDFIGTVRNFGTIQGTGFGGVDSGGQPNGSDGIAMGGGIIENAAGALISGATHGILIDNGSLGSPYGAVAITNAGTIQGLTGAGILITGDYANTVINSGTISGAGSEPALGFLGNGANTVTNTGTITASGIGPAVQFGNGNNVLTTSGVISTAGATGILFGNGNNALAIQGGSISGNVTAGTGSNTLTFALGSTGRFVVAGAYTGFGTATIQSGAVQVGNGGTAGAIASASIVNNGVLAFNRSDAALTVASAISGSGALQQIGTGSTTLTGANSFTGGTAVNAGTLRLSGAGSIGTGGLSVASGAGFDASAINAAGLSMPTLSGAGSVALGAKGLTVASGGSFAGAISGAGGSFAVTAGTMTLSGANTYTGATQVSGGSLVVNGSIASSSGLTVGAGGLVGGTGTLPSTVIGNGGTLSPGNSPGTINVAGNLTLQSGSTTVMEVQGTTSDRIVVSGTAALGGTLRLVALGNGFGFNQTYNFLQAGNVTGSFSAINTQGAFGAGVNSFFAQTGNGLSLTLQPNALAPIGGRVGAGQNQLAVAATFDRAVSSGNADVSAFFPLYNLPVGSLPQGLSQLSGEVHAAGIRSQVEISGQVLATMLDPWRLSGGRLGQRDGADGIPTGKYSVWAAGFGGGSRWGGESSVGSHATTTGGGGVAVGADMRLNADWLAGFALAGAGTQVGLGGGLGRAETAQIQGGVYASGGYGPLRLAGAVTYGGNDVTTRRSAGFMGVGSINGHYTTSGVSTRLEAAWRVTGVVPGVTLTPGIAFQGSWFDSPDFTETTITSLAPAALAVQGRNSGTSRIEVGVRADAVVNARISAFGRLAWGAYLQRDARMSASFVGLPGSGFTVNGARPDEHVALVSAGVDWRISPQATLTARVDGEFSGNGYAANGTARIRYAF
jgi:autotransporter-associated beta strand protein